MGNILPTKPLIKISLLHYDANEHKFSRDIHVEYETGEIANEEQTEAEAATELWRWRPSDHWMNAYLEWNSFGEKGVPHFESACQVRAFNKEGARLCEMLQKEVAAKQFENFEIRVFPYRPLYSMIEVGNVTSWWHIRDSNYPHVIIPIQQLPVSEDLKMKLQAWRMRIAYDSFDKEHRKSFNEEGHELQREIISELNWVGTSNPELAAMYSRGPQQSFDEKSFPVPAAIAIE